jgi:adenosylhomocysteine nucleosidase
VKGWAVERLQCGNKNLKLYTTESAAVVCGGMGFEAARSATEAMLERIAPALLISAGFARAMISDLRVGDIVIPAEVFDMAKKKSFPSLFGTGQLWTSSQVIENSASPTGLPLGECKAMDMEAAGVADAAKAHDIPFIAVKAISDEAHFKMPPLGAFIRADGGFRTARFLLHIAVRPGTWRPVAALAINSNLAAGKLCRALESLIEYGTFQGYDLNVELTRVAKGCS